MVGRTNAVEALSARSWPVRILRSFAASLTALIPAVSGHSLGGGEIVSGDVIGAVFAAVFAAVFVLTLLVSSRRLTTGQIVGLLLIAQIAVHAGCAVGGSVNTFGPAMVIGHLLATTLATWVLVRAEGFLWTLADRLGLRALSLLFARIGLAGPTTRLRCSRRDIRLPLRLILIGGIGLRGPPVGCA